MDKYMFQSSSLLRGNLACVCSNVTLDTKSYKIFQFKKLKHKLRLFDFNFWIPPSALHNLIFIDTVHENSSTLDNLIFIYIVHENKLYLNTVHDALIA